MAKGFSTLKIKPAVSGLNSFNLDFQHKTTMDFGQILPIMYKPLMPRDKVNVKLQAMARLATLKVPTYGDIQMRFVYGFVPYYQVVNNIEAFFTNMKLYQGTKTHGLYLTMSDYVLLLKGFKHKVISTSEHFDSDQAHSTDWYYIDYSKTINGQGTGLPEFKYINFGVRERYYVKILNMLGYALPQMVDFTIDSPWLQQHKSQRLNILHLVAFFKFYNDWFTQMSKFNSSRLTYYLNNIRTQNNVVYPSVTSDGYVHGDALSKMFDSLKVTYGSDYFTTMWDDLNNPIAGQKNEGTSGILGADEYNQRSFSTLDGTASPTFTNHRTEINIQGQTKLSALQMRILQSLDKWIRRNNYSGTVAATQVYSRFGVRPQEFKSNFSTLITKDTLSVRIGDVTQTSGTNVDQGTFLGDYAGKGYMQGGSDVNFEANEFGCFFCFCYLYPRVSYSGGFHHEVFKTSPLDFYNPEFDGVGLEAVTYNELTCLPPNKSGDDIEEVYRDNEFNVFGYMERYNDLRFSRDLITGDFIKYKDYDAWHLNRDVSSVREGNLKPQSDSLALMSPDDKGNYEYDRIFNITAADYFDSPDHFYMDFDFKVSALRPIKNSSQVADLGDGSLEIERLGLRKV